MASAAACQGELLAQAREHLDHLNATLASLAECHEAEFGRLAVGSVCTKEGQGSAWPPWCRAIDSRFCWFRGPCGSQAAPAPRCTTNDDLDLTSVLPAARPEVPVLLGARATVGQQSEAARRTSASRGEQEHARVAATGNGNSDNPDLRPPEAVNRGDRSDAGKETSAAEPDTGSHQNPQRSAVPWPWYLCQGPPCSALDPSSMPQSDRAASDAMSTKHVSIDPVASDVADTKHVSLDLKTEVDFGHKISMDSRQSRPSMSSEGYAGSMVTAMPTTRSELFDSPWHMWPLWSGHFTELHISSDKALEEWQQRALREIRENEERKLKLHRVEVDSAGHVFPLEFMTTASENDITAFPSVSFLCDLPSSAVPVSIKLHFQEHVGTNRGSQHIQNISLMVGEMLTTASSGRVGWKGDDGAERSWTVTAGDGRARAQRLLKSLVVPPTSWQNSFWELFGSLLILYDVITIPMQSYNLPWLTAIRIIMWIQVTYWSSDVPRQFFVSYEDGGLLVKRPWLVARHYMRTWLIPDLVIVSMDWMILIMGTDEAASRSWRFNSKMARASRICKAVKLLRILRLKRMLHNLMDNVQSMQVLLYLKVTYVTLGVVLCAHYAACYWYLLTTEAFQGVDDRTWVSDNGLDRNGDDVLERLYVPSLQWSLAQSSFASTDIVPTNVLERVFSCCTTLLWLLMTASVYTCLTVWGMQLRDMCLDREKQEAQLRRYMTDHRISAGLSRDVMRFARMNYGKLKVRIHEEEITLWKDLPVKMRVELHKEVYQKVLLRHRAMRLLHSAAPMMLEALCHLAVGEQHFLAGQTVFSEGETAAKTFILHTGELNYYFHSRRSDAPVQPGDWISEAAIWIRNWRYVGTLITGATSCLMTGGSPCELYCLDVAEFYAVVVAVERTGANLEEVREYARTCVEAITEDPTDLWRDLKLGPTRCSSSWLYSPFSRPEISGLQQSASGAMENVCAGWNRSWNFLNFWGGKVREDKHRSAARRGGE